MEATGTMDISRDTGLGGADVGSYLAGVDITGDTGAVPFTIFCNRSASPPSVPAVSLITRSSLFV